MIQQFTKEQLESEIWKNVKGFEGHYKVSSLGRIMSLKRIINPSCIIKEDLIKSLSYDKDCYLITGLRLNAKSNTIKVHRLVLQHFSSNNENKPQVNHINGIKTDNRVENLEWCTSSENILHSFHVIKTHIPKKGKEIHTSVLSESDVLKIREIYAKGFSTHRGLANQFHCTYANISNIIHRKIWKHI